MLKKLEMIEMRIRRSDNFSINYNLKLIRRIMGKYNFICYHRKANPYRRMMKAYIKEYETFEELVTQ